MNVNFQEIKPEYVNNIFKMIGSNWMLITAGKENDYNMLTAGWGGLGVLWGKNVCFCFIRPGRYTFEFIEKTTHFTLNFFDDSKRKLLEYCGSNSGRDVDKMKINGLSPEPGLNDTVFFNEAELVFGCKKIYFQDIDPDKFLDTNIQNNYPKKDYHRMYVGEIIYALAKS